MTALIVSPPVGLGVYQSTRALLVTMLGHAQQMQAAITANSILSSLVLNLLQDCINVATFATQVGGNANLIASILSLYATDQQITPTAAGIELNAMSTASAALGSAIQTDYPKAAGGLLADRTFGAGGTILLSTFTASQFPNTATALTAWLATVQ